MTGVVLAPIAAGDPVRYAALAATLALLVGGVCLVARLARLGFLADLLSKPVLVGYMTGDGWNYFPSFTELVVTLGLISFEILAYIVISRRFPVHQAQPAAAH